MQGCGRYVDFIPLAMRGLKLKSEVIESPLLKKSLWLPGGEWIGEGKASRIRNSCGCPSKRGELGYGQRKGRWVFTPKEQQQKKN